MGTLPRFNFIALFGGIGAVVLAAVMFSGGDSPSGVANNFMVALAKGDVEKLTELSYMSGKDARQIREAWTYTTKTVGPHYRFTFRIVGSNSTGKDSAAVTLQVVPNAGDPASYEQKAGLSLNRVNGKWKVVVGEMSRMIYPGLPR